MNSKVFELSPSIKHEIKNLFYSLNLDQAT